MSQFDIRISKKGLSEKSANKLVRDLKSIFDKAGVSVLFTKQVKIPESRSERLQEVKNALESAGSDVEVLKEEMEEWYDNLPEGLQSSEKANQIQEAIDALDSLEQLLTEAFETEVNFPGMY